jgi:hypothetical protein
MAYNRKIKAALLPERQNLYEGNVDVQTGFSGWCHTINCTFGLYAVMKI